MSYLYLVSRGLINGPRNLGANEFFHFKPSKALEHGINEDYLVPAVLDPRHTKFFTFSTDDWKSLKQNDKKCYLFVCHKPRDQLPEPIKKYIEWGETECTHRLRRSRTRGQIRTANQAEASQTREVLRIFLWLVRFGSRNKEDQNNFTTSDMALVKIYHSTMGLREAPSH